MKLLEIRDTFLVVVVIALGLLSVSTAHAQDITVCSLPLPKAIPQAHASFNAVYEFDVDKTGTPINVKSVEEQFTKLADVQICLATWSLPQSALTHVVAAFEWQHGRGWTKLAVSGPTIKLTIRLSCDRCSYANREGGNAASVKRGNRMRVPSFAKSSRP